MNYIDKMASYYDRLRRAYKYAKESKLLYDPVDTPLGYKFFGHLEMERGVFEPEETKISTSILKNVEVFVNIGANIGYYSCLALGNKVYSIIFEPMQGNLAMLYRNLYSNDFAGMYELYPIALSNKSGLIEMFGSGTGASTIKGWANTPEWYISLVPVSTLDTILGSRLSNKKCFILMDVEGAERWVLEGARNILFNAEQKPIWMVEISTTEHQPKGVHINPNYLATFELFWESGYEAWTASEVVRKIDPYEIRQTIKEGKSHFPNNNFLFIERGKKDVYLLCGRGEMK